MGAAVSSGHSSCPNHRGRLMCVDSNDVLGARCRVCQVAVKVGVRVHRCRNPGCGFLLHDGCFRFPATVKRHFAHPGHRLTLIGGGAGGHGCSLCAERLITHAYAYSCAAAPACSTGGFRAHPRCCHLPPSMSDAALHPHGRLDLSPPPSGAGNGSDGGGRARRRKCLRCRKTTDGRTARAWSYQCDDPVCDDKEICLACVLGDGDDDDAARCCCVQGGGDVDPGRLGEWIGNFLCGIGQAMGIPCFNLQCSRK